MKNVMKNRITALNLNQDEIYGNIFDSIEEGVYIADNAGNLSFVNRAFANIFRYQSKEDLLGINLANQLYDQKKDRIGFLKKLNKDGQVQGYEIRMIKKDGSKVIISARSNLIINKEGIKVGVEGVLNDVTAQRVKEKYHSPDNEAAEDQTIITDSEYRPDPITQLMSYRFFLNQLNYEIKRTNRFFSPLSLMLLDVDAFHKYNNEFGKLQGDLLLKHAASLLKEALRDTDIICRQAQDQFLILLPSTKKEEVLKIAKTIKDAVQGLSVTCSIGISRYVCGMTEQELLLKANLGLCMAKESGKNEACLYG